MFIAAESRRRAWLAWKAVKKIQAMASEIAEKKNAADVRWFVHALKNLGCNVDSTIPVYK